MNELAYVVGQLIGILTRPEVWQELELSGFDKVKTTEFKRLLLDLAKTFYGGKR